MVVPATCSPGIAAGMAALQLFYNTSTGLWETTNWWNAANALETTIVYSQLTDSLTYRGNIFNTFYQKPRYPNFVNPWFNDDDGWWVLTWARAYELTGQQRYLDQAKLIFQEMAKGWDAKVCGGGLYWHKRELKYKNAITNGLFLAGAAKLALLDPSDPQYQQWATRSWQWFQKTKMINAEHLVNDGLDEQCRNNGKTVFTYNQGVLIGGLVDLYSSVQDPSLLDQAEAIADATIHKLAPQGILREPCEPDCGNDGIQFKGIFMRRLSQLYAVRPKPSYRDFIRRNAESIWANRNSRNLFGLSWDRPLDQSDAARQTSALDALNAAIALDSQTNHLPEVQPQASQFRVQVACSGKYHLTFYYTSVSGATPHLQVNGRTLPDRLLFPSTKTHNHQRSLKTSQVWLNSGENTITVIFDSSQNRRSDLQLTGLKLQGNQTLPPPSGSTSTRP